MSRSPGRLPNDLTPSLVIRLRKGDAEAGRLLQALHADAIHRFCLGYLKADADAQDVVQDVFVQVLRSSVVPDHFRPWLYKIARNQCLKALRTRRRKPPPAVLPEDSQVVATTTGPITRIAREEFGRRIQSLVAALPESQNEILRLRYAEGLSREEISEVLDLPVPIVKSRLYEAMKKLREHPSADPNAS